MPSPQQILSDHLSKTNGSIRARIGKKPVREEVVMHTPAKRKKFKMTPDQRMRAHPSDLWGNQEYFIAFHEQFGPSIIKRRTNKDGDEIGATIFFIDGSWAEMSKNEIGIATLGHMSDYTDQDEVTNKQNRLLYWEYRQERAIQEYDRYKRMLLDDNNAHHDEAEHLAKLKTLKKVVSECHEAVMKAKEALAAVDGTAERKKQEARFAKAEQADELRRDEFQRKVKQLAV